MVLILLCNPMFIHQIIDMLILFILQSAQEKHLQKKYKKHERRLAKVLKLEGGNDNEKKISDLEALGIYPDQLRASR